MDSAYILIVCFAFVAFIYASVGFGGGSSYLALLALAALPFQEIRLIALLCNIIVVLGNSLVFLQTKNLKLRKCLPLLLLSIPMAFLGARVPMHEKTYFLLIGLSLILAAVLLWFPLEKQGVSADQETRNTPVRDAIIGGLIGLLSGMIGIGGGIFLSPVLHFLKWDSSKSIAAAASLFILANSVAGLAGQLVSLTIIPNWAFIGSLGIAVLIGGQFGLRYSLKNFSSTLIRKITAALVLFAGLELLWKHIFGV